MVLLWPIKALYYSYIYFIVYHKITTTAMIISGIFSTIKKWTSQMISMMEWNITRVWVFYIFKSTFIKNKGNVVWFYLPLCSVGLGNPLRNHSNPWFNLNWESNLNGFINCPCITWLTLGLCIVSKTLCSMSAHMPQDGTIAIQCVYLYSLCTTGQQWTNPTNMAALL